MDMEPDVMDYHCTWLDIDASTHRLAPRHRQICRLPGWGSWKEVEIGYGIYFVFKKIKQAIYWQANLFNRSCWYKESLIIVQDIVMRNACFLHMSNNTKERKSKISNKDC